MNPYCTPQSRPNRGVASRFPQRIATFVGGAGENEKKVRQAVHVTDDFGVRVLDAKDVSLGTPAHPPADVKLRGAATAAGKDERIQWLQGGVHLVTQAFQPTHVVRTHPEASL